MARTCRVSFQLLTRVAGGLELYRTGEMPAALEEDDEKVVGGLAFSLLVVVFIIVVVRGGWLVRQNIAEEKQ